MLFLPVCSISAFFCSCHVLNQTVVFCEQLSTVMLTRLYLQSHKKRHRNKSYKATSMGYGRATLVSAIGGQQQQSITRARCTCTLTRTVLIVKVPCIVRSVCTRQSTTITMINCNSMLPVAVAAPDREAH